jgi:hypothetical protein
MLPLLFVLWFQSVFSSPSTPTLSFIGGRALTNFNSTPSPTNSALSVDASSTSNVQQLECQKICEEYSMIPSFILQPQSYLPSHVAQLWSEHSCHSLSISCSGQALPLPTLLTSYHPHTFPSSSSPSDDWKQKCLHIFRGSHDHNHHNQQKGKKQRPLIVFNIASKPSNYYGMLVASALKFNFKLITLGWLVEPEHDLPCQYYFGYKLISVYEILSQCYHHKVIHNHTIIMVVDGTDVILQRDSSYVLNEFHQTNASILFTGEWPKSMRTDFTDLKYEQIIRQALQRNHNLLQEPQRFDPKMLTAWNLRPKEVLFLYLNSGCFIGKVGALLEWYQYWTNPPYLDVELGSLGLQVKKIQPIRQFSSSTELWNGRKQLNKVTRTPGAYFTEDQFHAIHMYLDDVVPQVQVDMQAKIFLSTLLGGAKVLPTFLKKNQTEEGDIVVTSIQSQTTPAVIHLVGPSKYLPCMSDYVKTFYSNAEVDQLFQDKKGEGIWNEQLVMFDANLDLVPSSLVTSTLLKSWIPRFPMRCQE